MNHNSIVLYHYYPLGELSSVRNSIFRLLLKLEPQIYPISTKLQDVTDVQVDVLAACDNFDQLD